MQFDVDHYCDKYYVQAVFVAIFSFVKGYGELIFASLEFVPKFLGAYCGINDEQMVKVGDRRMFFVRHAIDDVLEALKMYRQAIQTGQVQLPWQEGSPINMMPPQSGSKAPVEKSGVVVEHDEVDPKSDFSLVYFPQLEAPFYLDDPPFRKSTSRGALVSHIMLNGRNRDLEKFLGDKAISQWIEDRLMWPLNEGR